MTSTEWGTKQWQNDHFPKDQLDSDGDTWGMRWRGMDKMRHSSYLKLIGPDLLVGQSLRVLDIGCALCDFTKKAWNLNQDTESRFQFGSRWNRRLGFWLAIIFRFSEDRDRIAGL